MRPLDEVLARLEDATEAGNGKWSARCPAHADRSPSLAIAESDAGAVLLHCFAGCSIEDICIGLGMDMGALFPPDPERERRRELARIHKGLRVHKAPRLSPLVKAIEADMTLVLVLLYDVAAGKNIPTEDQNAAARAITRIEEHLHAGRFTA